MSHLPSNNPKISVIIPSYNQASFIEETLQSVIHQNYPNTELIVIDGGSTDGTVAILEKYARHISYWVSEKDRGQSHAINKGFAKATGEIIAWQNSDDTYAPNAFEIAVETFAKNPHVDVVYGAVTEIDAQNREIRRYPLNEVCMENLIPMPLISNQAMFFKRSSLIGANLVDEKLSHGMDYELFWRLMLERKVFLAVPEIKAAFRRHENAKSTVQIETCWKELFQVYSRVYVDPRCPQPIRLMLWEAMVSNTRNWIGRRNLPLSFLQSLALAKLFLRNQLYPRLRPWVNEIGDILKFYSEISTAPSPQLSSISEEWLGRIAKVQLAPDNARIPRVSHAGTIKGRWMTMHNGIEVLALGYYGEGILQMLRENHGVHEPEEEYEFGKILKTLPEGSTMLELGAYWGYYSLWFQKEVKNARSYLIEPEALHILSGKFNFRHNKKKAVFVRGYVGEQEKPDIRVPTLTIDGFCQKRGIEHLAILHSDIQGYELEMLRGAHSMLSQHKINNLFISTHSQELHQQCLQLLQGYNYTILRSVNLTETYSYDGLIVAQSP